MTVTQTYLLLSTIAFVLLGVMLNGTNTIGLVLKAASVLLAIFGIIVLLAAFGFMVSSGVRLI